MQFGPLTLKRCRYGWMLFAGPLIGKCFELYGEYSESEVAIMRSFVRPGDTVLDIGASIGDLTIPLAQMVGPQGRVYAFESRVEDHHVLCANLALNQITNVRPISAFVRDSFEIRKEFVSKTWSPESIRIDDLNLDACRLIKIDVDGNELDVIKSASNTIEKYRPVFYLENDIRPASKALLSHLFSLNYNLLWHLAPIFQPNNFFGNPVNHWFPRNILSIMVLGVPKETTHVVEPADRIGEFTSIQDADDWPKAFSDKQ